MSKTLFDEIAHCRKCPQKYGEEPFHFPIAGQEVVLISANPSIQAMYRPMTSIRFFRRICTALFGEVGISNESIKIFNTHIYWTHYQKCYQASFHLDGARKLDNNTCREYIVRELDALSPRLIIILGTPTAEALLGSRLNKVGKNTADLAYEAVEISYRQPCKTFVTEFPDDGEDNARFKPIRTELVKIRGFEFMEQSGGVNPTKTVGGRLAVNIDFEWQALERMIDRKNDSTSQTADALWLEKVVIPNRNNQMLAAQIAFFIEDVIKTCLYDLLRNRDLWNICGNINKSRLIDYQVRPIPELVRETGWRSVFIKLLKHIISEGKFYSHSEFLSHGSSAIYKFSDTLAFVAAMRNTIIHQGGACLPSDFYKKKSPFMGIKYYVNQLLVEDQGILNLAEFAKEVAAIIKEIDDYAVKQSYELNL